MAIAGRAQAEIERAALAQQRCAAAAHAIGTGFGLGIDLQPLFGRALGDDVDDAADRVGAIERALVAAQDFDPVDVAAGQVIGLELGADRAGVAQLDTVDQPENLIIVRSPDADAGQLAGPVGRRLHAGRVLQYVFQEEDLVALNIGAGDDRHRAADLARFAGDARGGDDDGGAVAAQVRNLFGGLRENGAGSAKRQQGYAVFNHL